MDAGQFYRRAVERLWRRYREIIGDAADGIADKTDGIEVRDDDIYVDEGFDDLDSFVASYEDILGGVATRLARKEIRELERPDGTTLPERLV